MTKDDAWEVLLLYRNWNEGQQSILFDEQAILDERRKLLLKATQVIAKAIRDQDNAGGDELDTDYRRD